MLQTVGPNPPREAACSTVSVHRAPRNAGSCVQGPAHPQPPAMKGGAWGKRSQRSRPVILTP